MKETEDVMRTKFISAFWSLLAAMTVSMPAVAADFLYPPSWTVVRSSDSQARGAEDTSGMKIDEDVRCNIHALTAIGRVPAVRIVVYDPVSNSFSYVDPCPRNNDQILRDRYHLALTTQKIRLLLLPYNAADGNLLLEVKTGTGAEFDLLPKAALPAQTPATAEKPREATEAPPVASSGDKTQTKAKADAAGRVAETVAAADQGQLSRTWSLNTQTLDNSTNPAGRLLLQLEALIASYREATQQARDQSHAVADQAQCLDAFRTRMGSGVGQSFAQGDFTLAHDVSFDELERVARARAAALKTHEDADPGCAKQKGQSFAATVEDARRQFTAARSSVETAGAILDRAAGTLASLEAQATIELPRYRGERFNKEAWEKQQQNYENGLKDLRAHHETLEKLRDDAGTLLDTVNTNFLTAMNAFNSAASQIQRFEFPPLHEDETISFIVRRTGVDAKETRVPGKANMIELRSTPADLFRFGVGAAKTNVKDPSFRVAASDDGKKHIVYDDAGNGSTVVAAFVHHNWTRRSPFLTPTWFERFMPTLSMGVPLTDTKALFDQLLVGFNWELTPGFDFVLGQHFKKVNTLIKGYEIGQVTTLDTTDIQQKKFRNSWFFGVAMNTDLFTTLGSKRAPSQ